MPLTEEELQLQDLRDDARRAGIECPPAVASWEPFPVSALPPVIERFACTAADSIGCDETFVILPVLSILASAIGNSRRLHLKDGWSEPAIIWTAVVSESGSKKSPALEAAMVPLHERQKAAMREYRAAKERFEFASEQFDRARKSKNPALQASHSKPVEPVADRCWCDDTTTESLAALLQQQPRGLLCARDELSGWIGSFDRYSGGGQSDAARWLEMFGGRSMLVDRKGTGNIHVPRASVSLTGGIQPGVMARVFGAPHRESGLMARLLLASPPRTINSWSERGLDPVTLSEYRALVDSLFELQAPVDEEEMTPLEVTLADNAKPLWIQFFNDHAVEQSELSGDLGACWSKMEGYCARLALVIHLARWASEGAQPTVLDAVSMRAAITITRWFCREAKRVYASISGTTRKVTDEALIAFIRRKGGTVTVRDIHQGYRPLKDGTAEQVETALLVLACNGLGKIDRSGKSTKFTLGASTVSTVYDTSIIQGKMNLS